jgi:predicted DCC family thiol-disulfide oxidoreductase YuxK
VQEVTKTPPKGTAKGESILLFDGFCNLCTQSVRFILKRDRGRAFRFASIQSGRGGELYRACGFDPKTIETFVLIEGGRSFFKSDAAIRVAGRLSGLWPLLALLDVIPKSARDWGYDVVARNRYRWFGKTDQCMVPTDDDYDRFIE